MAAYNVIDYFLIAVFILSILFGLSRGGVREIISLLVWIVAFIIASKFASPLAGVFEGSQAGQNVLSTANSQLGQTAANQLPVFAVGVSFVALFFGSIMIGSVFAYLANSIVSSIGLGFINRILGAVFGFVRGYMIDILIIFLVQLTSVAQQEIWTQSVLVQSFQPGVQWLGNTIQPGIAALKTKMGQTLSGVQSTVSSVLGGQ